MPNSDTPREAGDPSAAAPGDASPSDASPSEDAEPGFENRAARRARGKGSTAPAPNSGNKQLSGRGSVQGPRQWGNRRSG